MRCRVGTCKFEVELSEGGTQVNVYCGAEQWLML